MLRILFNDLVKLTRIYTVSLNQYLDRISPQIRCNIVNDKINIVIEPIEIGEMLHSPRTTKSKQKQDQIYEIP